MMPGRTDTEKRRIQLLSVPLDLVSEERLESTIDNLLEAEGSNQIVLLDLWNFVRARGSSSYAKSVRTAALVLPTSKAVETICRFLKRQNVTRVLAFDFVIRLLSHLEQRRKSIYVIGSRPGTLQSASANLRGSFPELPIVGRCAGYFGAGDEQDILLAIRKAAPSLVLAGKGLPGKDQWPYRHRSDFSNGITIWCGSCIEVFSGKKKRTSRELWGRGLDFLPSFAKHPWRIYRLFVYLWLMLRVVVARVRE